MPGRLRGGLKHTEYNPYGDAWPCPSCGLMITDAEQHHRVGECRARKPEKCPHCGLMKLRGVEHKCSVIDATQKNQYAYLKARARQAALNRTESIS